MTLDGSARFQLARVAFFGRTLGEYLRMFALEPGDLRGMRILDVASGPGSFVAEAVAMGLDATGCDPMYDDVPEAIAARGRADIDACREQIRTNPRSLVYDDIEAFYAAKYAALERFAADYRQRHHTRRYVAAALPFLPFADRAFDLVLTANFLFVYAPLGAGGMHDGEDFGLDFHLRAVEELARVTCRELRIPGIHTWTQQPEVHPYCGPVVDRLGHLGFTVALVRSDYDDGCTHASPNCNNVLVATR